MPTGACGSAPGGAFASGTSTSCMDTVISRRSLNCISQVGRGYSASRAVQLADVVLDLRCC